MKYLVGDIENYFCLSKSGNNYDAICCTTNRVVKNNGELVMGAGVAKVFAECFPDLPKIWGQQLKQNLKNDSSSKLMCFHVEEKTFYRYFYLVAFPTKNHWKNPSDIVLIRESTEQLVFLTDIMNFSSVLLPKPGCANGGLNWEKQVKPILGDYLDDRFTIIDRE